MKYTQKIAFAILLVLCLNYLASASTCPGFFAGDLLQSGKKQFLRGAAGSNQFNFQAPISFNVPAWGFQWAAATSNIGGYNPSAGGFNFQIDAKRKGTSNFIQFVVLVGPSQAWTSIQISYLVSARNDFVLWNGNYLANQWIKKSQVNIYDVVASVNKPLPAGVYKVAVFLSGFSTTDKSPRIAVNQRFFDLANKRVTITIFCGANPLPISISLSYIIYPDNHPILQVSYGVPKGDTGAYQISGPTSFSTSVEYNEFRIDNRYLSCTGNQCEGACILRERCIQLNGNVYQGQCIFCAPGIIFEYGCTRRCGANQDFINRVCICKRGFTRSGRDCISNNSPPPCKSNQIRWNSNCRPCPAGSFPDGALSNCICQNNYQYGGELNVCTPQCSLPKVLIGGSCVCPADSIPFGNDCRKCPPGSTPSGNTCICQSNFVYGYDANTCNPSCNAPKVFQGGACVCPPGLVPLNDGCVSCPAGTIAGANGCVCPNNLIFDPVKNTCYGACQNSQQWNGNRCVCISGYYQYLGKCRPCPRDGFPTSDGKSCDCYKKSAVYLPVSGVCLDCGSNAAPDSSGTRCQCFSGFRLEGAYCVPIKVCDFNQDLVNGVCQCKFGFLRVGPNCVERCGRNQYFDGNNCVCNEGHAKINNVCRPCPPDSLARTDKLSCVCKDGNSVYIASSQTCRACPPNSYPTSAGTECICSKGYTLQGNSCVSNCPGESLPNSDGNCVCPSGKTLVGNQCVVPVTCPPRSAPNPATFACTCLASDQNIINGVCQKCDENSRWVGNQCVCITGFFRIAGQCRTCDPRTKFNGTDCVCNLGYFGNRDKCQTCHPSCSQCTGPDASQCTACADISLVLQKGYCTKSNGCKYGYYLDGQSCTQCLVSCIDCDTSSICNNCAIGYQPKSANTDTQKVVYCEQICGDGIKYEQQCDDGNTYDGDGCSSQCQQQKGWFCSGGSTNKPSKCVKAIPDQTIITSKGAVNMGTHVLLSVRASYLPSCMTKDTCLNCYKAITANVVNANVPVIVTINFIPSSQYQFVIKYDFGNAYVTSIFKTVIKLNEDFRGCFFDDDFNEQIQLTIDPAFLAKIDLDQSLSAFDIGAPVKRTSSGAPGERKIEVPRTAERLLGI